MGAMHGVRPQPIGKNKTKIKMPKEKEPDGIKKFHLISSQHEAQYSLFKKSNMSQTAFNVLS